jgi:hypothetical protein
MSDFLIKKINYKTAGHMNEVLQLCKKNKFNECDIALYFHQVNYVMERIDLKMRMHSIDKFRAQLNETIKQNFMNFNKWGYLIIKQNTVIGFALGEDDKSSNISYLQFLFVLSHERRSGYGTALLKSCKEHINNRVLLVHCENCIENFYISNGFDKQGIDDEGFSILAFNEPSEAEVDYYFKELFNSCQLQGQKSNKL